MVQLEQPGHKFTLYPLQEKNMSTERLAPTDLTTAAFNHLALTGEPFAITNNRAPVVLAFPCRFDKSGEPTREELERIAEFIKGMIEND